MKLRAAVVSALFLLAARPASGALTTSELAQVRDFVARGRLDSAARVRSLVARTDLTADESASALRDALVRLPFDEPRSAFVRELLFGASSAGARPLLATAVTRALLARADAVLQRSGGGLEREPRAIAELLAIYAFLDVVVANAGKPTTSAHDPSAGIPPATYEECSKALRDHVEQNARWLKGDGPIPESLAPVRAQAHAALLDMLPDGLTRRVDAGDRLGLGAARRRILNDWGVLLEDSGKIDELGAERVRQALARLPGARADVELVFVGDDRGPLRARGLVVATGATAPDGAPFGDEVTAGNHDASTSGITLELASRAAKRALDERSALRREAERDAAAAAADPKRLLGRPRAPSVDDVIGAAVQLLALDPRRAIDVAFARFVSGSPEPAALLSDAIGALVTAPGATLDLGKSMTAVQLAPTGAAVGFTFEGHTWVIERGPSGVTAVKRDGLPITVAMLPSVRVPLTEAGEWSGGGMLWRKLRGAPRASVIATEKAVDVRVMGASPKGLDAIATQTPGADFVFECELEVRGTEGGIAIRGEGGSEGTRGVMLLVSPGARIVLGIADETGAITPIAAPIERAPSGPVHVRIRVKGAGIEAAVGAASLKGALPASVKKGDLGLVARRATLVHAANVSVSK